MSARNDSVYIRHIEDAVKKIDAYIKGVGEEEFARDTLTQDGVIRQLEIIGEAAKRVSEEVRNLSRKK